MRRGGRIKREGLSAGVPGREGDVSGREGTAVERKTRRAVGEGKRIPGMCQLSMRSWGRRAASGHGRASQDAAATDRERQRQRP